MSEPIVYDTEDLVDAVKGILTSYLPAAIVEVNTQKADSYTIKMPEKIFFGNRRVDPSPEVNKFVIVVYSNLTEGETFSPGVTSEDTLIDTMVIFWGSKAEECERKILRYAKVIRFTLDTHALFKDTDPKASNIGDSVVSTVEYLPLDLVGDLYFKAAIIRLKIKSSWCY